MEQKILGKLNAFLNSPLAKRNDHYYPEGNYYATNSKNFITLIVIKENIEVNIDDIVECLSKLKYLYHVGLKLRNLRSLVKLKRLTRLNLFANKIDNIEPIGQLLSLTHLNLSHNEITDIYPLRKLIKLESLNLSYNQIVDITPLEEITSLTTLNLNRNQIIDISPLKWMFFSSRLQGNVKSDNTSALIYLHLDSNPIQVPSPSIMEHSFRAVEMWFKDVNFIPKAKIKILSIDDSKLDLFIVEKILKEIDNGHEIISCINHVDSIDIITKWKPDLILLNLSMPVMDGFDVASYMETHKIDIPMFIMSSSINENDLTRIHELPVIKQFVNKPLTAKNATVLFNEYMKKEEEENRESENQNEVLISHFEIGLTLVENEIKLVKLYKDGRYDYFDSDNDRYELLHSYSQSIYLKETIQEFEYLINKQNVKESELQNFFDGNQDFILNDDYKKAHGKFKLTLEDDKKDFYVPDFILEPYNQNALCDILEIKLPNVRLFTIKKNRIRYSSAVYEVCAQLREYAAYFEDSKHRKKISDKIGLNVYRPRMIAIIGRHKNIEPITLRRVQSELQGFQLVTYDDVLEKMKRKARK